VSDDDDIEAKINAVWAEHHIERTSADMTNECRLASVILHLRERVASMESTWVAERDKAVKRDLAPAFDAGWVTGRLYRADLDYKTQDARRAKERDEFIRAVSERMAGPNSGGTAA
jgi:hypothetical protein